MRSAMFGLALAATMLMSGLAAAQTTLRIGLQDDPDQLDPARARTFVGRIVFASICDKLFDVNAKLEVVPQLGLSLAFNLDAAPGSVDLKFQDSHISFLKSRIAH